MTYSFRSFRNVAGLVHARLRDLSPQLIKSLWRHIIKYLFEYLVFKPL